MYIYDVDGNLICLDGTCILIKSFDSMKHEAQVWAQMPGVDNSYSQATAYTLHRGTVAECRDFVGQLATHLKTIVIRASSTQKAD